MEVYFLLMGLTAVGLYFWVSRHQRRSTQSADLDIPPELMTDEALTAAIEEAARPQVSGGIWPFYTLPDEEVQALIGSPEQIRSLLQAKREAAFLSNQQACTLLDTFRVDDRPLQDNA